MLTLAEAAASPEWFPGALYANRGLIDCYRVDRALLATSPFLDQRMTARARAKDQVRFAFEDLGELADADRTRRIAFVFHTSFCRSTLMAQALHLDGISFSLKEPAILLSLAESIRFTQSFKDPARIRMTLHAMLKLATGLVTEHEKPVVKPTNFANNLLPYVAESGARILLMHTDLRAYLVTIAKYGEPGRLFTRRLFTRLMQDSPEFGNLPPRDALMLTDLQIAALCWKQQIALFAKTLESTPANQVRTLTGDLFGAQPRAALGGVCAFFDIPVSAGQLDDIVTGPVFQQHSKDGKNVDNEAIRRRNQAAEERYRDEIEAVLRWTEASPLGGHPTLPVERALAVPGTLPR